MNIILIFGGLFLYGFLQMVTESNQAQVLPIVYNVARNQYVISDVRVILQDFSEPRFKTEILLFCGKDRDTFYQLNLEQIYKSVDAAVMQNLSCQSNHKIHVFQAPKLQVYSWGFGYMVSPYSEKMILENELAKNVSGLQCSSREDGIIVIWFDALFLEQNYHKKTLHRFLNYKRELKSPTYCDDYQFQLDESSKQFNVNNEQYYDMQDHDDFLSNYYLPDGDYRQSDFPSEIHYFEKHRMVPIDDFVEDNRRVVACGDFNTMPIWNSISNGILQKIEYYIQTVAQYVPDGTLFVRTEVKDILQLQKRNNTLVEDIYLKSKKGGQIPVPKYVVKIVSYKVPNIPIKNELDAHYHMVIVVHNEIGWFSDRLCNRDRVALCKENGWDITTDGIELGSVYCCRPEDLKLARNAIIIDSGRNIFNLRSVVTHADKNGEIAKTIDITQKIAQDMQNEP